MSNLTTAAQHFEEGERLLAAAAENAGDSHATSRAARALAHFKAAEVLLKAEELRHAPSALGRSGLDAVIEARYYKALSGT
jgi:hypothetical protein